MDDVTDTPPGAKRHESRRARRRARRHLRDWLDPLRLYDPRIPAGRFVFLWGLAIFPLAVMFVLLTVILIVVETISPNINSDTIGIIVWFFMLAWVAAAVAITYRRLLQLDRSQRWVWVAILPIVSLPRFLYLLLK